MTELRWAPEAIQDRLDIFDYISQENPSAAARLDELFSQSAASLTTQPLLGKTGLVAGTRELIPHPSYRLVYEIVGDIVWVLAIVHTARRWPPAELE